MAQSGLDLSLDEIIKENRARSRDKTPARGGRGRGRGVRGGGRGRISQNTGGRGGVAKRISVRGQGVVRGRGTGLRTRGSSLRGRINNTRGRGAVQRQSRSRTPARLGQQNTTRRSVSRGRFADNQNVSTNPRLRSRSRSRTRFQNVNVQQNPQQRSRSRSRSRTRVLPNNVQQNVRSRSRSRSQNRFNGPQVPRRSRSRTPGRTNNLPKTGIAARLGNNKQFAYSSVGLRSDMILRAKQNQIKSQTFTRSGSLPKSQETYTVSVANDRMPKRPINKQRRNSFSAANAAHLDQHINNLATSIGGVNLRGRSGSLTLANVGRPVRSLRGRGRGRGGINYANKQILNPQLQMEIAALQGKSYKDGKILQSSNLGSAGINFIPTPHLTTTRLSDRFNCL